MAMEKTSKDPNETPIIKAKSNALIRTITAISLLSYFAIVVYVGVPLILLNALIIQIKCFDEVITIAYNMKKIPDIPCFRTLNWYFVIVANYFFSGETFAQHFEPYVRKYYALHVLVAYHRFFSFCWYFAGVIWFLSMLKQKLIQEQFSLFFWTHFLIIIISLQTYSLIQTMFEGLIWVVMSICLITLNDIFAYIFGKFFGKTPLILLSPKKTVEGYILGGASTFVFGAVLAYIFCHLQFLVCSPNYVGDSFVLDTNCTRSYLFKVREYSIGNTGYFFSVYPFILHSLSMSVFASIIAPFGGFCASGFKRAVKVKDFGNLLPGHGGFMDRFDCLFLMATFVNAYINAFIRSPDVDKIFQRILSLGEEGQIEFYHLLKGSLNDEGILNG
ncbi:unnamed protein product [Phaedon cochleariae]|uniref:Phosphatidate cytidylyltransferase n=1 Tax=Phaedon cochleariae TaxID=80249 RepID=A0A9P0GX71_PHACE|nr:unnamed protein product [Phaedon cochleariae]